MIRADCCRRAARTLRLLLLTLPLSWAIAPAPLAADRSTVEQKLKLVGGMVNSPRMLEIERGAHAEAKARVEHARRLVEQGRAALTSGDVDLAEGALDQALKAVTAASSLARSGAVPDVAAQRARHDEIREQLRGYRNVLSGMRDDPALAKRAGEAIAQMDLHLAQAKALYDGGRYAEANRVLSDGYLAVTGALRELRAGQTVVQILKLDTPADEYAYEERINQSTEALLALLVSQGRVDAGMRGMVDKALDANRVARIEAERGARAGNHGDAAKSLEAATLRLKNTMRLLGIPTF